MTSSMAAMLGAGGINDLEKRKTVEVRITRANAPDSVFAQKDGRVRVMKQIPGKVGIFGDNLFGDIGMALCGDQYLKTRGGE